ncbi:MAG: hypothetical protein ACKOXS_06175, partial [Actinomycetes bacterium]
MKSDQPNVEPNDLRNKRTNLKKDVNLFGPIQNQEAELFGAITISDCSGSGGSSASQKSNTAANQNRPAEIKGPIGFVNSGTSGPVTQLENNEILLGPKFELRESPPASDVIILNDAPGSGIVGPQGPAGFQG